MATEPTAASPTVAIARVLRRLGLVQGRGGDFRVTGWYRNGERDHTYVVLYGHHAAEVCAAHADDIERAVQADGGWCFRVSVRYFSERPTVSIANAGERIRETPPAPPAALEEPAQPEPADEPEPVEESEPAAEPTPPVEDRREARLQRGQAAALGWATAQAELVASAAAGQLRIDPDGSPRYLPVPGWAGQRLADGRLAPLVKAGFLVIGEPDTFGSRRVDVTADGRRAVMVWKRWRPTPVAKDRAQEREQLRPLRRGQEQERRHRWLREQEEQREVEWKVYSEALDRLHAWEKREERMAKAWATVNDLAYAYLHKRPAGWVPTEQEVAEHQLAPEVVADLRAEAVSPQPQPELPRLSFGRGEGPPPLKADAEAPEQLDLFGVGLPVAVAWSATS
ncbi:hypothetical protein [Streptomyces sp. NPDC012616]|uniref:hypothetical protein n=1 Tax=Streptomyces sp. NPDC012616 TaxID=3364840 RepID=UPI0036EB0A9B